MIAAKPIITGVTTMQFIRPYSSALIVACKSDSAAGPPMVEPSAVDGRGVGSSKSFAGISGSFRLTRSRSAGEAEPKASRVGSFSELARFEKTLSHSAAFCGESCGDTRPDGDARPRCVGFGGVGIGCRLSRRPTFYFATMAFYPFGGFCLKTSHAVLSTG